MQAEEYLDDLLTLAPDDMSVVKELTSVYLAQDKSFAAILLYERMIKLDEDSPLPSASKVVESENDEVVVGSISLGKLMKNPMRVGYEELNILAELYLEAREFRKLIIVIKSGLYRIQGLNMENFVFENDSDFENYSSDSPIQIIVHLGICRLLMGDAENVEVFRH
jgi:tetratricopeptide (TPR) repeat protein